MALKPLISLGSYEDIGGGAHRKAASIVGTPCLVRRIGFWNTGFPVANPAGDSTPADGQRERRQDKSRETTGQLEPEARSAAYRAYFADLRTVIESDRSGKTQFKSAYVYDSDVAAKARRAKDPTESGSIIKSGMVSILQCWWHGMLMNVRLEYHSEYITITSILDLSIQTNGRYRSEPGQPDFQQTMRDGFERLGALFEAPLPSKRRKYREVAFLQEDLWKAFEDGVLNAELRGRRILEDAFGEVFVDFRGMVSGSLVPPPSDGGTYSNRRASLPADFRFGLRPPFKSTLPRRRAREMRHERPPRHWVRDSLRRLWPLMESAPYLRSYEFTVSGLLDGRALYISALGPQLAGKLNQHWSWTPVYYYIHAYTDDEWQIGRLIDRINTLGTMRLAATIEIASLVEAGRMVEDLAGEIERASASLQEKIKKTKPLGQEERPRRHQLAFAFDKPEAQSDEDRKQSLEEIMADADGEMRKIQIKLQEIDDTVSGNIAYRLERSQYYLNQWKKEVEELREVRVEGFQMYREFVMRRMGGIFGYVDLLRARMVAINGAIAALGRQYASLKIAHVTCSIDGLVSSLRDQNEHIQAQNDHMAEQHRDMEKQEKEIRKIQEFGEIALIGAIVPYYLGTSVFHYLLELEGLDAAVLWLLTLTAFALWVLGIIARQMKSRKSPARLRLIFRLFAGYVVFIWVLFALRELPLRDWIEQAPATHSTPAH